MKIATIFTLLGSIGFSYTGTLSPENALQRLMKGNERFSTGALEHPNRSQERREASQSKQTPYAVIVGCSDSRVSPEIIFDEGVGDLFVVRVAGNVVGPIELESIEYAAHTLKSVLILVLGHESCGAVDAVVQGTTKDLRAIALSIGPSILQAKKEDPQHLLEASIKANAIRMKDLLLQSEVLKNLVKEKKVEIKAGYYNLQSGVVELL